MREDPAIRNAVYELVLGERACQRGYFNMEELRRLVEEHMSARANHQQVIGLLMTFELFHRLFID